MLCRHSSERGVVRGAYPPVGELAFLSLCRGGGLTLGGIFQLVLYLQTALLRHFSQQIINLQQQQWGGTVEQNGIYHLNPKA